MSDICFRTEELGEIAALLPDDPRLTHADDCPRCRILLANYREFMATPELSSKIYPAPLRARIASAVDQEILGPRATTASTRPSFLDRLAAALRGPVLRPALAAGVLLVIVVGFYQAVDRSQGPEPAIVLRGDEGVAASSFGTLRGTTRDDGSARLSWESVPGADSYEVHLYDETLEERAVHVVTTGSVLELPGAELAPHTGESGTVFWRVQARRGENEIARSEVEILSVSP